MAPGVGMLAEHDHGRNGARATEHGNGEWDEGNVVFGRPLRELLRGLLFPRRVGPEHRHPDTENDHPTGNPEGPDRHREEPEESVAEHGEHHQRHPSGDDGTPGGPLALGWGVAFRHRDKAWSRAERVDNDQHRRKGQQGKSQQDGTLTHRLSLIEKASCRDLHGW